MNTNTQYGLLKTWRVDHVKTTEDDVQVSFVTLADLQSQNQKNLLIKIGIKTDASHKGGVNLFGKEFGDHPTDIKMKIYYSTL